MEFDRDFAGVVLLFLMLAMAFGVGFLAGERKDVPGQKPCQDSEAQFCVPKGAALVCHPAQVEASP